MSIKILMPALSPTMTEGILQKWLVKIGDEVKAGDVLAEIETDKATMEVEAVDEGKVTEILVAEGTEGVLVNSVIAILNGSTKNEEKKIISPAIKLLSKKKIKIFGAFSADTLFIKKNVKKFDVIIGMYHDQVLTPIKTLYEFKAINVTLGLPFIRISPDHGPNKKMLNKNLSNPLSLIQSIKFLDKR